jgi:hypothetical protein
LFDNSNFPFGTLYSTMSDLELVKLARLLRDCANLVEKNEFHPNMYQAIADLHVYTGKHTNNSKGLEIQKKANGITASMKNIKSTLGKIDLAERERAKVTSGGIADRNRSETQETHLSSGSNDEDCSSSLQWKVGEGSTTDKSATSKSGTNSIPTIRTDKPAFIRPSNPESTLLANGWIEQQRRSKLRFVWKEVLASLVEGRKPNEETTFWIQREVTNSTTGKRELEALHKVPIRWLQEVHLLDFYGDYRFSLKVYNINEDFVFRCADSDSAQNWVSTLRSIKDEVVRKTRKVNEVIGPPVASAPTATTNKHDSTIAMESSVPAISKAAPVDDTDCSTTPEVTMSRMTVKEMRVIAKGAGINTAGMERSELERLVANVLGSGGVGNQLQDSATIGVGSCGKEIVEGNVEDFLPAEKEVDEEKRKKLEEAQALRVSEARKKAAEEEERRQTAILEEQKRQAALAEERQRAEEQKRVLEEQKRQATIAEEQRRRLAEQELRRQQEEQRVRAQQAYQQQQQQWQAQQAAQQQWQAQQAVAAQQRVQAAQAAQWQQWQQQQQAQQRHQQPFQQPKPQAAPYNQNSQQQPQSQFRTEPQTSNADIKYTKMAAESNVGDAVSTNTVKRNILTHWALQPPGLQHLRSIADLLISIHTVFPPAFGVPGHEYFKKWTPITHQELTPVGAGPDMEKLSRAVKKLRFFLHPDKLPRDLSTEQQFMCKMLWDISSDAWEEFKKRKEELDWMQKP